MGQTATQPRLIVNAIPAHGCLLVVASEFWLPTFSTAAERPSYCHYGISAILPGTKLPGGKIHHMVITNAPGQIENHILALIENDLLAYRTRTEFGPEGDEEERDEYSERDHDEVGAMLADQRETALSF